MPPQAKTSFRRRCARLGGAGHGRAGLRRPPWRALAVGVAIVCTFALVAASGYIAWHHRQVLRHQQRAAEVCAAPTSQGVVALFSIDHNKAKEDVQRILDNSTGQFRDDFRHDADDLRGRRRSGRSLRKAQCRPRLSNR